MTIKLVTFPASFDFFTIHNGKKVDKSSRFIKQNTGLSGNKTSFVKRYLFLLFEIVKKIVSLLSQMREDLRPSHNKAISA